jgi:purine-binding chemotaxis protein CheW
MALRQNAASRFDQQTAIDWNEIYHRLAAAQAALEQGVTLTPAQKQTILNARAKALAQEPQRQNGTGAAIDVVAFQLAHETYALESCYVREVYPLKEFTWLPCTPPFVLGIVNVRGQIFSLIDLKKFFDLPDNGLTDLNKIIILHSEQMEFGILADAVLGLRKITAGDLQPPLPTLTGIREAFLKGLTSDRLIVLDAGKLLASQNLIVQAEVEA